MIYLYAYLFICLLVFMFNYDHFLVSLLCLEFIVLGVLLMVVFSGMVMEWWFIYLLIFSVCEAVTGLVVLIFMVSKHGSDYCTVLDYKLG